MAVHPGLHQGCHNGGTEKAGDGEGGMIMPQERKQTIGIEFRHHGYMGWIHVNSGRNHGVLSSGFSAISDKFTDSMVRGFPVIQTSVSFEGKGYEAMFGWFQVISHDYGTGETEFSVDVTEQFREFRNPFCYYGYKPAMYDAPRHVAAGLRTWKAYTFLCPLHLNGEKIRDIVPLGGFTWGYTLDEGRVSGIMYPLPAGPEEWDTMRRNVSGSYPEWNFQEWNSGDIR